MRRSFEWDDHSEKGNHRYTFSSKKHIKLKRWPFSLLIFFYFYYYRVTFISHSTNTNNNYVNNYNRATASNDDNVQ